MQMRARSNGYRGPCTNKQVLKYLFNAVSNLFAKLDGKDQDQDVEDLKSRLKGLVRIQLIG